MDNIKVFISYGHGHHDQVVKRLADDLRTYGIEVFLDVDYLHKGDWERIIDEHILACRYFLFMVSARSVSHDGYCLNELCRAGEVQSEIIPICLDNSTVPLSINKKQRLSLISAIDPDGNLVDSEYRKVLTKLFEILSGKVRLGFSDSEIRLRSSLKPISSKELTYGYYTGFSGRRDVFDAVEKFMASNNNVFWLNAGPGTGKTAISSMLTWRYPDMVGALHFCRFNNSDRVNPKVIITSVAYQLAEAIPEYKDRLLNLMELDRLFEKNATRIFEYLIIEPMAKLEHRKPLMVIIDALDECSGMGRNEICSILQRTRESLPWWLKFVLTSRNEPEVSRILKPISQVFVLSEAQTQEDLKEYYTKQFPEATEHQIEILINKSEGSFLYAREIVKQIRDDNLSLGDINVFPVGIYGFFNDCFSRIFNNSNDNLVSFEEVKPLLEFLCIEQEPTEISFLEDFFGWDEYYVKRILAAICSLFPLKDKFIEPLHKSIIDWLTSDDIDQVYFISRKNGYKRLLTYVEQVYADNQWQNNKYVLKYFGAVLIELGNFKRLAEILKDHDLQQNIIDFFEFDSGLDNYLSQIDKLHQHDQSLCTDHLTSDTFIRIFSEHRRLLYNSGKFFKLKDLGLSIALRRDNRDWGLEGEVGKVFYYYIVEDFAKAIKRAEALLQLEGQDQMTSAILSEIYNVKGLSERKLVRFDEALESFERGIEYAELAVDEEENPYSDAEFELSLAHLITGKIYLSTLRFDESNKNCRKAVKILSRKIDEMPDGDKRTSNKLFLAEDYRVSAYGYIWQEEYEAAEDCLDKAEEIYLENRNTVDRYYIRFQYTTQFLRIMERASQGVRDELRVLLKEASGKYDKGQINFLLALDALVNHGDDVAVCEEGLKCAVAGADIYDEIDAYLEKAECNMVAARLSKLLSKRVMLDNEENEHIDRWIEYIESVLRIGETV